jgi:hypothetical protein
VGMKYVLRFFLLYLFVAVSSYRQDSTRAKWLQLIEALKSFFIGRFAFSFALPSTCTGCLLYIRSGFLPIQDGLLFIRNVLFSVRGHGFG